MINSLSCRGSVLVKSIAFDNLYTHVGLGSMLPVIDGTLAISEVKHKKPHSWHSAVLVFLSVLKTELWSPNSNSISHFEPSCICGFPQAQGVSVV